MNQQCVESVCFVTQQGGRPYPDSKNKWSVADFHLQLILRGHKGRVIHCLTHHTVYAESLSQGRKVMAARKENQ